MPKSSYSLILSDDIIREVDVQARRLDTSRSALIDRILAEYLSLSTPEMRLWDILEQVQRTLERTALQFSASAGGTMTLRTALEYKYNPSVSYTVELQDSGVYLGSLRAAVRSQNARLLGSLQVFFSFWERLENAYLPTSEIPASIRVGAGRMERLLRRPVHSLTSSGAAEAITAYVSLLDGCMKTFFDRLDQPDKALDAVEAQYRAGLKGLGAAIEL